MNLQEAESLFNDKNKCVTEDIEWFRDQLHPDTFIFKETVYCKDLQMSIKGSFNTSLGSASFTIIHPKFGRIYALDHGGHTHQNNDGKKNGTLHKHRYRPEEPDYAYVPEDITAEPDELSKLWKEFCTEARVFHSGQFFEPDLSKGLFDD